MLFDPTTAVYRHFFLFHAKQEILLKHSIIHFAPIFWDIAYWIEEHNPVVCFVSSYYQSEKKKMLNNLFP